MEKKKGKKSPQGSLIKEVRRMRKENLFSDPEIKEPHLSRDRTRGNSLKLHHEKFILDIRRCFFSERAVRQCPGRWWRHRLWKG